MRMVGTRAELVSGLSQPSGTGRVIPLSWSTRTAGSASGAGAPPEVAEGAGLVAGAWAEVVVVGAAVVPSSSRPSRITPATAAPRTSAPESVTARILVRLPPVGPSWGPRRCGSGAEGGPNPAGGGGA